MLYMSRCFVVICILFLLGGLIFFGLLAVLCFGDVEIVFFEIFYNLKEIKRFLLFVN